MVIDRLTLFYFILLCSVSIHARNIRRIEKKRHVGYFPLPAFPSASEHYEELKSNIDSNHINCAQALNCEHAKEENNVDSTAIPASTSPLPKSAPLHEQSFISTPKPETYIPSLSYGFNHIIPKAPEPLPQHPLKIDFAPSGVTVSTPQPNVFVPPPPPSPHPFIANNIPFQHDFVDPAKDGYGAIALSTPTATYEPTPSPEHFIPPPPPPPYPLTVNIPPQKYDHPYQPENTYGVLPPIPIVPKIPDNFSLTPTPASYQPVINSFVPSSPASNPQKVDYPAFAPFLPAIQPVQSQTYLFPPSFQSSLNKEQFVPPSAPQPFLPAPSSPSNPVIADCVHQTQSISLPKTPPQTSQDKKIDSSSLFQSHNSIFTSDEVKETVATEAVIYSPTTESSSIPPPPPPPPPAYPTLPPFSFPSQPSVDLASFSSFTPSQQSLTPQPSGELFTPSSSSPPSAPVAYPSPLPALPYPAFSQHGGDCKPQEGTTQASNGVFFNRIRQY